MIVMIDFRLTLPSDDYIGSHHSEAYDFVSLYHIDYMHFLGNWVKLDFLYGLK